MSVAQALKQKLAALFGLEVDPIYGILCSPIAPSAVDTGIKKLSIDFPSGEVFACDWPQFEKLQKHIELTLNSQYFDLNTAAGREANTRFIAEQFGFLSIFVSNSDPYLFVGPAGALCAHRPFDDDLDEPAADGASPYREVAQIRTSMWWATLVDMQALRNLASLYLPQNDVENFLSSVRSNTNDHMFFNITPGTHTVYFDNNHLSLVAAVKGTPLESENMSEPYFIITQNNLDALLGLNTVEISP